VDFAGLASLADDKDPSHNGSLVHVRGQCKGAHNACLLRGRTSVAEFSVETRL